MNNSRITFESQTAINSESKMSGMHYIARDITVIWFDDAEHGGQARRQTHQKMTCVESKETRWVNYSNFIPMTNADAATMMTELVINGNEITEVIQY